MKIRVLLVAGVVIVVAGLLWSAAQGGANGGSGAPPLAVSPALIAPTVSEVNQTVVPAVGVGLSATDRSEVTAFAARFATVFARPNTEAGYQAWWPNVRALMTDSAAADFEGTDPGQVPYTRVVGSAKFLGGGAGDDAGMIQRVRVATDAGIYFFEVQLVTPGLSDRLLISGIEAP